jgi:hypothetical protein
MFILTILAAIIALSYGLSVLHSAYRVLICDNINTRGFYRQIKKLIRANNIDRAIKLCNAEPNAIAPRLFKSVLTRANRSIGERTMTAQGALYEAERKNLAKRYGYGAFLLYSATFLLATAAVVLPNGLHPWPLIVVVLSMLLGVYVLYKSNRIIRDAVVYFDRVFTLLAARQGVALAQETPRKELTNEQVTTWRKAMDEFTEYVKELRERGGKFTKDEMPAHVLYTKVADPETGMLNPGFDRPY